MTGDCIILVPADLSRGLDKDFCLRVEEAVERNPRSLRLDCSGLDTVHSSHIGLLWQAREKCRRASIDVLLENTNDSLMRTLQALDLADLFVAGSGYVRAPVAAPSPGERILLDACHEGEFAADVDAINRALDAFLELLETWHISEDVRFDLRTMFYEVATNIRCHADLPPRCLIQYHVKCESSVLHLVFEDDGKPFNPLVHPDCVDPEIAAQTRQTRGFGIRLVRRLADDMQYARRDNTTNVLRLMKRIGDAE